MDVGWVLSVGVADGFEDGVCVSVGVSDGA